MNDALPSSTSPAPTSDLGTSYPSPVSTTTSPNMDETILRSTAEPSTQRPGPENLRAASAALQAAYRRIRQVRRSLVELTTESLPSPESVNGAMGPDHSALVLTASPVEESSDSDEAMDFRRMRTNLAAVDRQMQDYLFAPGSWSDHQRPSPTVAVPRPRNIQLPSPSPSTSEPIQPPSISRRSMLETHLARRREALNSDDPATFIGRRVAAREAAGPSRASDPTTSYIDPDLRAAELERELMHLRSLSRRTDPGMAAGARVDALSRSDIIRAARSLDMETPRGQRQQPVHITNVAPHPWPPRRWRTFRSTATETRQNSTNTQSPVSAHPPRPDRDRLSLLSNFSVQNLQTPTSALPRDRPLLFEEPLSYVQGQRRESRDTESPAGSERGYFIHRRLNADGDELVHNINLDLEEEDPLSWLNPPRHRSINDHRIFSRRRWASAISDGHERRDSAGPEPPIAEPRRRGWARLDPDGNAIPSDEEEELERSRAEYRIRALYHARASAAAVSHRAERAAQSSIDVPGSSNLDADLVTRTSVSPDDEHDDRDIVRDAGWPRPRVRLNSREVFPQPRTGFGTVMDSVLAVESRPRQVYANAAGTPGVSMLLDDEPYGSSMPFVVDPLPMPLSEMVISKNDHKVRSVGVRVSGHAGLAGR